MHWLLLAAATLLPAAALAGGEAAPATPAARAAAEAMASTREELREARRELEQLSRRVAVLAQQASAADLDRALDAPPFARPALGIVMAPDEDGVRLAAVTPGSPAARAGLRGGDRLLAVQGERLAGKDGGAQLERARELIGSLEEGQRVELTYARGDEERSVDVEAAVLPGLAWMHDAEGLHARGLIMRQALHPMVAPRIRIEPGSFAPFAGCGEDGDCDFGWFADALRWRGLRLAEVDASLGRYFGVKRGVLVLKAEGEGLEALQAGDVILAVQGEAVATPEQAMQRIGSAEAGERLELQVQRDRRRSDLAVTAPELSRWQLLAPPPPPAPPAPPTPASPRAAPAPEAPAAPPAPPPPPSPPAGVLEQVLL